MTTVKNMMIKNSALAATLLLTLNVQAGEWVINANVGHARSDLTNKNCEIERQTLVNSAASLGLNDATFSCEADDSDTGYGLSVGYMFDTFNNNFGLELGSMKLGEYGSTITAQNTTFTNGTNKGSATASEITAQYLAAVADFQISSNWYAGGRLGISKVKTAYVRTGKIINEKETELMAGINLDYQLTPNWRVGARYDIFNSNESVDIFSLNLSYRYGNTLFNNSNYE